MSLFSTKEDEKPLRQEDLRISRAAIDFLKAGLAEFSLMDICILTQNNKDYIRQLLHLQGFSQDELGRLKIENPDEAEYRETIVKDLDNSHFLTATRDEKTPSPKKEIYFLGDGEQRWGCYGIAPNLARYLDRNQLAMFSTTTSGEITSSIRREVGYYITDLPLRTSDNSLVQISYFTIVKDRKEKDRDKAILQKKALKTAILKTLTALATRLTPEVTPAELKASLDSKPTAAPELATFVAAATVATATSTPPGLATLNGPLAIAAVSTPEVTPAELKASLDSKPTAAPELATLNDPPAISAHLGLTLSDPAIIHPKPTGTPGLATLNGPLAIAAVWLLLFSLGVIGTVLAKYFFILSPVVLALSVFSLTPLAAFWSWIGIAAAIPLVFYGLHKAIFYLKNLCFLGKNEITVGCGSNQDPASSFGFCSKTTSSLPQSPVVTDQSSSSASPPHTPPSTMIR